MGVNTSVFTQMATFLFCLQLQGGMKGVFALVHRVAHSLTYLILIGCEITNYDSFISEKCTDKSPGTQFHFQYACIR